MLVPISTVIVACHPLVVVHCAGIELGGEDIPSRAGPRNRDNVWVSRRNLCRGCKYRRIAHLHSPDSAYRCPRSASTSTPRPSQPRCHFRFLFLLLVSYPDHPPKQPATMSSERIANATPGAPTAPSFLSNAILSNGFVYCSGQLGQTPDGKMVEGPIGKRVVSNLLCWLSPSAQRTGSLDVCCDQPPIGVSMIVVCG